MVQDVTTNSEILGDYHKSPGVLVIKSEQEVKRKTEKEKLPDLKTIHDSHNKK